MERLLWLLPVGALAVTAILQDLQAFSLTVTVIGILYALRQGRGAPGPFRSVQSVLPALLLHLIAFLLGGLLLGRLFPNAAHDSVQAGDRGYLSAVLLGIQATVALLLASRGPVQRVAARLTLLAGPTVLLTPGVLGHGRRADGLSRG